MSKELSDALVNGSPVPEHSAKDTSLRVIFVDEVRDAYDGFPLSGGLHGNEVALLMRNEPHGLGSIYRYSIREVEGVRRIFHTRRAVRLTVQVEKENHN